MAESPERDDLQRFRDHLRRDLMAGQVRTVMEYIRQYPQDPDTVAAEVVAARQSPGSKPSERVGPYRIDAELGRGGQGVVYLATDERLGRQVALKVLTRIGPGCDELLRRFQREAEVASKLQHPGICAVYDAGILSGVPYIAMQLVTGVSLAHRIASVRSTAIPEDEISLLDLSGTTILPGEGGEVQTTGEMPITGTELPRLSRTEVLRVTETFEKIARALHAAHEAGVIHRDVKPGNVMLTEEGEPVVLDFGLARESGGDTMTQSGDFLGTPAYMSPEQVEGAHGAIDRRSDVWSLGVTLYECLTLVRPFQEATRQQLYRAIAEDEPVSIRYLNAAVGRDLEVVIETCLRKDPNDRYQTAADLAEDLRRARVLEPLRARPLSRAQRTLRWVRRHPARAGLLTSLLVLGPLLTGLLVYISSTAGEREKGRRLELANRIEARLDRGYFELGEGSDAVAEDAFSEALRLESSNVEAMAGKALSLLEQGREAEARALVTGSPVVARLRCVIDEIDRRTAEGEVEAGLVEPASTRPEDLFVAGLVEMSRGHAGEPGAFWRAERHFARAVTRWPESPRRSWYTEWLHAIGHIGQAERCREIADVATGLWPDSEQLWFHAGRALTQVDLQKAAAWLERYHAARPEAVLGMTALAKVLVRLEKFDAAGPLVARALELAPDRAETHAAQAAMAHEQQDWPVALEAYRREAGIGGESTRLLDNMSRVLSMMERDQEAEQVLRRLIARNPGESSYHMRLGYAAIVRQDFVAALTHYEKAAEIDPGEPTYWVCLGEIYHNFGRFPESLAAYRRGEAVGRLDPSFDMPAGEWAENAVLVLRRSHRLDDLLAGAAPHRDHDDLDALLQIAKLRKLPDAVLKLWQWAREDRLAFDEVSRPLARIHCVRDAVEAGLAGVGEGAPWLDQALALLNEQGEAVGQSSASRRRLRAHARQLLEDVHLAGLREEAFLAGLTAERRRQWKAFWNRIEELEAE